MIPVLIAYLACLALANAAPTVTNATSLVLQPTATFPTSTIETTDCVSDNFVKPWILNNLVIISPAEPTDTNPVHVSFAFSDPNDDLQLTTTCLATAANDGTVAMSNGGYVGCEDQTVRFQLLAGDQLLVSRWYRDPCKGTPPYDSGIAFGQADTEMLTKWSGAGTVAYQERMEMNVTRMT